jgi:hypothetical protein
MAECSACGASYSPGEHFCGNCGAQLIPNDPELKTMATTLGDEDDAPPMTSAQLATTLEDAETRETPVGEEEEPGVDDPAAAKSDSFHESAPEVAEAAAPVAEVGEPVVEVAEPVVEAAPPAVEAVEESQLISSESLGGSYTDSIQPAPAPSHTSKHRGTTGGHQPTVKQLPANTVLNGRY